MATNSNQKSESLSANLNIEIVANRTLNRQYQAVFCSGTTEYDFDLTPYTGASLSVRTKPDFPNAVLEFDTDDGSITLDGGNLFSLKKTYNETNVRHGEYIYDMYLRVGTTHREFLAGKFTITNDITK